MDRFFSWFGKFMLVAIVIVLLVGAGFYFGTGTLPLFTTPAPGAVTTTAPEFVEEPTTTVPTELTPTVVPTKTVQAGVTSDLSFSQYSIDIPTDWTVTQEHEDAPSPMDTILMVKGEYSIKIFQAATGGALCLYPGDPDFEGPSSRFTAFVPITTKDGTILRRGDNTTICQKSSDGSYGQPTTYGHISFKTPAVPDEEILASMDAIIASLKKL